MHLTVNDEGRQFPDGSTVADIVGGATRGVAVAVNQAVVPRSAWRAATLNEGDRIEILQARQGG